MKTMVRVFLSIAVSLSLGACSNAITPATNTPPPTITFTPEPTGTPTTTTLPAPLEGKGSVSLQISCLVAVTPQGLYLYSPVGSGYPISLIVVYVQSREYSFVAKDVTDAESRVFFSNIDPGVYSVYFGDPGAQIPASYTVPSINVVENEARDLGKIEMPIECATIYQ